MSIVATLIVFDLQYILTVFRMIKASYWAYLLSYKTNITKQSKNIYHISLIKTHWYFSYFKKDKVIF